MVSVNIHNDPGEETAHGHVLLQIQAGFASLNACGIYNLYMCEEREAKVTAVCTSNAHNILESTEEGLKHRRRNQQGGEPCPPLFIEGPG